MFIWSSNLTFDWGIIIFHQKSNVDFLDQLLSIYKSEFHYFSLFRFLGFLVFHWHINCNIWILFDRTIWPFPLRCSFRGFSDIWFSIIHSKSISYPNITNFISINSIFSLVCKYIIFVIFWHCLIIWSYKIPTVGQSQHFDIDFWLFSLKSRNSILKTSYLVYLYPFLFIKSYFCFFKTPFKPKFDQVNSAIQVNPALYGSTRYLHITWFYIFIFVISKSKSQSQLWKVEVKVKVKNRGVISVCYNFDNF